MLIPNITVAGKAFLIGSPTLKCISIAPIIKKSIVSEAEKVNCGR